MLTRASRFLPRFRLATALAVLTIAAAWCAFQGNRARYERQVEREVRALGGTSDANRRHWAGDNVQEFAPTAYERFLIATIDRRYIRHVDLGSSDVSPEQLDRILRLPHLESLGAGNNGISDTHLRSLGSATRLVSLDLSQNRITDQGLRALPRLRRLQSVSLAWTAVGDETLQELSQLSELVTIDLSHTKVTGEGIRCLAAKRALHSLHAEDTPLRDDFLTALAGCSRLQRVDLIGTDVSDEGVRHLSGHPSLASIRLDRTFVTEGSLETIASMRNLVFVSLRPTWPLTFSDEALAKFRESRPDIRVSLARPKDEGIFPLSRWNEI